MSTKAVRGWKRIVEAYKEVWPPPPVHTETGYRMYKRNVLGMWLEKFYPRSEDGQAFVCTKHDLVMYDYDAALTHLRVHKPRMFEAGPKVLGIISRKPMLKG